MFTQPAPAAGLTSPVTTGPSSTSTVSPASPSRTSRLRGLSYLRNYTQNHLLSREHSNGSTSPTNSSIPPSAGAVEGRARPTASLTRSLSYTPTTTSTTSTTTTTAQTTPASTNLTSPSHRFSLVPTLSHPLGSSLAAERPTNSTTTTNHQQSSSLNTHSGAAGRHHNSTLLAHTASAADSTPGRTSMTRTRSATAGDAMAAAATTAAAASMNASANNSAAAGASASAGNPLDILPSIRFSTFYDPRATRPSLTFSPIARTLPTGSEVIRVGRYSERDSQPPVPVNVPSAAPVGFKSKVVSRRHCEFWYEAGKWYIRDVKSSSGTFLNHIRLSPPGTESKPFPVGDGDIVQLGIDFKGGEEMIFRCVKMRLELNRGWQNKLNTFNMNTHKKLRNMTRSNEKSEGGAAQSYSQDCSICLNSIAPCQCLFVAPCSHTWHYKCIRSLLSSPQYPIFICPNCRAAADLEAEVEDPEEWEQEESEEDGQEAEGKPNGAPAAPSTAPKDSLQAPQPSAEGSARRSTDRPRMVSDRQRPSPDRPRPSSERKRKTPTASPRPAPVVDEDDMDVTMQMQLDEPAPPPTQQQPARINTTVSASRTGTGTGTGTSTPSTIDSTRQVPSHAVSQPVPIPNAAAVGAGMVGGGGRNTRTPSPNGGSGVPGLNGTEGPITPRNDAGPWVFDGSGLRARASDGGITRMESLDGVAGAEID